MIYKYNKWDINLDIQTDNEKRILYIQAESDSLRTDIEEFDDMIELIKNDDILKFYLEGKLNAFIGGYDFKFDINDKKLSDTETMIEKIFTDLNESLDDDDEFEDEDDLDEEDEKFIEDMARNIIFAQVDNDNNITFHGDVIHKYTLKIIPIVDAYNSYTKSVEDVYIMPSKIKEHFMKKYNSDNFKKSMIQISNNKKIGSGILKQFEEKYAIDILNMNIDLYQPRYSNIYQGMSCSKITIKINDWAKVKLVPYNIKFTDNGREYSVSYIFRSKSNLAKIKMDLVLAKAVALVNIINAETLEPLIGKINSHVYVNNVSIDGKIDFEIYNTVHNIEDVEFGRIDMHSYYSYFNDEEFDIIDYMNSYMIQKNINNPSFTFTLPIEYSESLLDTNIEEMKNLMIKNVYKHVIIFGNEKILSTKMKNSLLGDDKYNTNVRSYVRLRKPKKIDENIYEFTPKKLLFRSDTYSLHNVEKIIVGCSNALNKDMNQFDDIYDRYVTKYGDNRIHISQCSVTGGIILIVLKRPVNYEKVSGIVKHNSFNTIFNML